MSLGACIPVDTVYVAPPTHGHVIDGTTGEPVAEATVQFAEHAEPTTTTDSDGRFELPALSERRYFRLILPGSAATEIPIKSVHATSGYGISWAHQLLNARTEPERSEVIIITIPPDAPLPLALQDCTLSESSRYAAQLSAHVPTLRASPVNDAIGAAPPDLLMDLTGHLQFRVERAARLCTNGHDEIEPLTAPLRDLQAAIEP